VQLFLPSSNICSIILVDLRERGERGLCDGQAFWSVASFKHGQERYRVKVLAAAVAVDVELLLPSPLVLVHQVQQLRVALCPDCLQV